MFKKIKGKVENGLLILKGKIKMPYYKRKYRRDARKKAIENIIAKYSSEDKPVVDDTIISIKITLKDGANINFSSQGIYDTVCALGEEEGLKWHAKYIDAFENLKNECWLEFAKLYAQRVKTLLEAEAQKKEAEQTSEE